MSPHRIGLVDFPVFCTISGNFLLCYSCVTLGLDPLTFRIWGCYNGHSLRDGTGRRRGWLILGKNVERFLKSG